MKHIDKTHYRAETGEISIVNRVQGMLKFGMSWPERVKAQDTIAAALGKHLGGQFTLLQSINLPETEIDLPLVLLGPPGVFLINALHERGVYVAREAEWGTISGEQFVPARINQVKRTQTLGKVLQVYLERLGYKGFIVDTLMISADPGLHIDSTRPAVRVVMSDALERFAISLSQARGVFGLDLVADLERVILTGKGKLTAAPEASPTPAAVTGSAVFIPEAGAGGGLEFSFSEENTGFEEQPVGFVDTAQGQAETAFDQPAAAPRPHKLKKPKRKKIMGLSTQQLAIVAVLMLCWLCGLLVFAGYYFYSIGWIQFA